MRDWAREIPPGTLLHSRNDDAVGIVIYVDVKQHVRPKRGAIESMLLRLSNAMFDAGTLFSDDKDAIDNTQVYICSRERVFNEDIELLFDNWCFILDMPMAEPGGE